MKMSFVSKSFVDMSVVSLEILLSSFGSLERPRERN